MSVVVAERDGNVLERGKGTFVVVGIHQITCLSGPRFFSFSLVSIKLLGPVSLKSGNISGATIPFISSLFKISFENKRIAV